MTELEAMQAQRDEARAQLDRLRGLVKARRAEHTKLEGQNTKLAVRVAELEHKLAVEKGRPGHDSYKDDLLKVTCAMIPSFGPATMRQGVEVAKSLLDEVYAAAKARKETKP